LTAFDASGVVVRGVEEGVTENLFLGGGKFSGKKTIGKTGIFTLKFRKTGWTEQSKVLSELILKRNLFMQTDALCA